MSLTQVIPFSTPGVATLFNAQKNVPLLLSMRYSTHKCPRFYMGLDRMQPAVWTLIGLVAYVCGLVIVITMTPRLLKLRYDEGLFMGIAVVVVSGGIMAFVPLAITFALFNGSIGVKIFDFLLLVGIFAVGLRMSLRSFRPRYAGGTFQVSRILAGSYCLLLLAASMYCIILLFLPPQS
jgi:hypothetical protein